MPPRRTLTDRLTDDDDGGDSISNRNVPGRGQEIGRVEYVEQSSGSKKEKKKSRRWCPLSPIWPSSTRLDGGHSFQFIVSMIRISPPSTQQSRLSLSLLYQYKYNITGYSENRTLAHSLISLSHFQDQTRIPYMYVYRLASPN